MASILNATTTSGLVTSADNSGLLQLQTNNGTTAVTIDTSQNVGIGTSSPGTYGKFAVVSADGYNSGFSGATTTLTNYIAGDLVYVCAGPSSGSNGKSLVFQTGNSGLGSERMRITSGGDLCVGTTAKVSNGLVSVLFNPSVSEGTAYRISSGTNATYLAFQNASSTQIGFISGNGSNITYSTSSDHRLKENIAPMQNALNVVQQLKPVTYNWKVDGSAGQGFIAHELAEVVPDCVTGEKDAVDAEGKPVYQGVDTSFLVATLTAAIQELKAELDATKAEVQALKGVA